MIGFRIQSPDSAGRIDPPVERILRQLPQGNDVTIVPVTRLENFRFAGASGPLFKGPWVLWDHSEFGWDWDQRRGYLWGVDRLEHPWFQSESWRDFDHFVRENPPVMTFQRELRRCEVTDTRKPCDYLNFLPRVMPDTRQQFDARPIDVCFQWGLSSESRVRLHANIFRQSNVRHYRFVSELSHIDREVQEHQRGLWCSIHTPHYARHSMEDVQQMFARSKIVVAMAGCGQKTFRHGEIPNSIMAFPNDELAWGVEWKDGANCIRLDTGLGVESLAKDNMEVEQLCEALKGNLYDLYRGAVDVADKLRPENYLTANIIPAVESVLPERKTRHIQKSPVHTSPGDWAKLRVA